MLLLSVGTMPLLCCLNLNGPPSLPPFPVHHATTLISLHRLPPHRCPKLLSLAAPQCISLHSLFEDAWEVPLLR